MFKSGHLFVCDASRWSMVVRHVDCGLGGKVVYEDCRFVLVISHYVAIWSQQGWDRVITCSVGDAAKCFMIFVRVVFLC